MTQEIGDKIKQEVTQQGNTGHRGDDFTRQKPRNKACLFFQAIILFYNYYLFMYRHLFRLLYIFQV